MTKSKGRASAKPRSGTKLDQDIARTTGGADDRTRKSYQNAKEALALAQQFSASDAPAAAAITAAQSTQTQVQTNLESQRRPRCR
jgi:hypothetical protein